ncbi:MAG: hypothetical protein MSA15_15945 [Clostridium sp.]|nr:hypothetical protein [Clostridium sp.]
MSNTTTKTNTTFRGIRKNTAKANNSLSARNIERLQRKAMHKLYQDEFGKPNFIVVQTVDIDDVGNIELGYQTVGNSPVVMAFGELDQTRQQITVNKDDSEREVVVGPQESYKLYNNIILVSFRNAEALYDNIRLSGLELGHKTYNATKYYAASGSASMGKKSKVYFTNHAADVQFETMNNLTGGLLAIALEKEIEQKGDLSFDDLAGIASRISLCATTPSLWTEAGKTNNVFYFNGSIQSANEDTEIEVDNNFRDGYAIISDRIGSEMVEELAGEPVSNPQARRMSYQLRIRGAAGKGHFRAYNLAQRLKEVKAMMEIDMSKCYCWEDGKKIDLSILSEKELTRLVAKIDIIGDKDVFKWGKYMIDKNEIDPLEIGLVNMSNKTTGSLGTQIIFKLRDDVEDATLYVKAVTERQLTEAESMRGSVSFEKDCIRLSNTAYHNCYTLNPERAEEDKLLNNFKVKQLDTALLNRVANLKLAINSNYMRMVPEDHLLNNRKEVLGSRVVNYVMPTGETMEVRALEVYSSAFEKEYREMKEELEANVAMTQEEKNTVLNNMRVATAIKSPSQGDNEFEVFYLVLSEEIATRNVTPEFMQFIVECPNNCIILAQDNTVKHQLAGSDFDGDDVTVIYPEFTLLENGKIVTGLYYDGRIINDYTSLIVRKRVREGNIGYAALIEYGMDTPMFATEEKEEQQEAAEYIKNMDISSLL